jgi:hypothetical protein
MIALIDTADGSTIDMQITDSDITAMIDSSETGALLGFTYDGESWSYGLKEDGIRDFIILPYLNTRVKYADLGKGGYWVLPPNSQTIIRYEFLDGDPSWRYFDADDAEKGIELIADALNGVLFPEMSTTVLLETMAGKGTEMGRSFEELREIIDRVELKDKVGVCFDTCHVWDAGYDIVNDLDGVLHHFDDVIGLDRLRAVHFNDSKNPCGAHKDRHEKLGQGYIGMEAMKRIALHPALQNKPFILETPNDDQGYIAEIKTVKEWMEESA